MQIVLNKIISFEPLEGNVESGWKLELSTTSSGGAPSRVFIHQKFYGPKPGFTGATSDYSADTPEVEWTEPKYLRVATEPEIQALTAVDPKVSSDPADYPTLGVTIGSGGSVERLLSIAKFGFYKYLTNQVTEYHTTWDSAQARYLEAKAGLLSLVIEEDGSVEAPILITIVGRTPIRNGTLNDVFPGDVVRFAATRGSGDYSFSVSKDSCVINSETGRFVAGPSSTGSVNIVVTDNVSGSTSYHTLRVVDPTESSSTSEVLQDV